MTNHGNDEHLHLGFESPSPDTGAGLDGRETSIEAPALEKNCSAVAEIDLEQLGLKLPGKFNIGDSELVLPEQHHITVINNVTGKAISTALKALETDEARDIKRLEIQQLMNEIDWSVSVRSEAYHLVSDGYEVQQRSKKEIKRLQAEAGPGVVIDKEVRSPYHKESVIVMAELGGLEEFYDRMKSEIGIDIGDPHPAHITLAVGEGQKRGIGISTQTMLDSAKSYAADGKDEGLRAYSAEGLTEVLSAGVREFEARKERVAEYTSSIADALLANISEKEGRTAYHASLVDMHFAGGTNISGSTIGIDANLEAPNETLNAMLQLYVEQKIAAGQEDQVLAIVESLKAGNSGIWAHS